MKNILVLLSLLIMPYLTDAQAPLEVRIEVFEPYPVELEYYLQNADNLFITVENTSAIEQNIYYHVRLIGNNGIDISTLPFVKPLEAVNIQPYYTKFYSSTELEQDFPFDYPDDIDLSTLSPEQYDYISFNRALPEGTYQLCITALDYDTDIPLTFDCSEAFSVSYGDVPFIYDPPHEDIIPTSTSNIINIAWEPPFTLAPPSGTFTYDLKMIDITDYPYADLQLMMDDPGVFPVFEIWDWQSEVYPYDMLANIPLEEGHEYALRVRAKDQSGTYNLSNNGYSEVSTFFYGFDPNDATGEDENTIPANASDCLLNCYYTEAINETSAGDLSARSTIEIGHFTISDIEWTSTDGNNASGSGVIEIPFLNDIEVEVAFAGLEVNATGRAYSGIVEAVVDRLYDPTQMDYTLAESMNEFIRNGRLVTAIGGSGSMGMPLGIIQNIAGYNLMLGFTRMTFTPERASCTLMQNLHIPQLGDEGWISMAGTDICLIPAGFANEYILHPVNDIIVPYQGDMTFLFNGSAAADTATIKEEAFYMHGDCNGLKELVIRGEVHFPEHTLVKEDANGEIIDGKVIGNFLGKYTQSVGASQNIYGQFGEEGIPEESGVHFMVVADIAPFQISGIPGWGFETNEIWIDVSDYENPPNIAWPESYDDANINVDQNGNASMGNTWTGVYIENLDIKPPKELLNGNNREGLSFNHMIIDPLITVTVAIEDLLQGNVDGWSLSMDSIFMTVVQNRLESGGFSGELGIPLTDEGQYFRYTAMIEDSNTDNTSLDPPSYVFAVEPSADITFPFLMAEASLSDNSHIIGKFTPGNDQQTYFETWLEGGIGISTELFTASENDANIPLSLPVVDFQLVYHSQNGFQETHLGFAEGIEPWDGSTGNAIQYDNTFGLQFSEESFAGFPLNIEEFSILPTGEGVQFSITPSVSIAGEEGGIAGAVGITFDSEMEETDDEKKLKLQTFAVSSLSISADVHGLILEGEVEFYNTMGSDQVGSKGARGDLQVMLPMGTGVQLAAEFGTQVSDPGAAFGTAQNYNYWYLDGMAYFAPGGIPIPPIAGIYGLGGGVYINMEKGVKAPMSQSEVDQMLDEVNALESSSENNNAVIRTGDLPSPAFGSYGLKLATTLGTLPTETLLNMDVSLYGSFSKTSGLNHLSIAGDAYMFTPLSMRNKSMFFATASLDWKKINEDNQEFSGSLDVFVNTDFIYGNPDDDNAMIRNAGFYTSTETGEWYLQVGSPDQRGELNIMLTPFLTAQANGYLMAGYGLPTDLPMPEKVAWLLDNPKTGSDDNELDNETPVSANGDQRGEGDILMSTLGNGVAFGAEFSTTASIDAFLLYASLSAFVGFDINLTQSSARTCFVPGEGDIAPGMNDWYALGQVYAGLEGDLGIRFKFKGKNFDLSLFELGAAMMLSGGGPNPSWVEGRAGVYYSVLGGLVEDYVRFDVTLGDKCVPAYDDPFGDLEIIYQTWPVHDEEDVSPFVEPMASFILPIDEAFSLPSYDSDGNPKDIDLKLEVAHFDVQKRGGSNLPVLQENWNDAMTQITMVYDEPTEEHTWYDAELKIICYEKKNGNWVPLKDDEGNDWYEKREWSFKSGDLPYPIPDDQIVTTIPIRRQRYFLQDEALGNIGKIEFIKDLKYGVDGGYFPEDDDKWDYSYYVRYQDLKGGEPEYFDLPSVESSNVVRSINSIFGELENSTIYSCQLVRKKEKKTPFNGMITNSGLITQRFDDEAHLMSATREIDVSDLSLDPGKALGNNEELIYQFYFRTSKFDSAEEKLATATVGYFVENEEIPKYQHPHVEVFCDEDFDIFDVIGEQDAHGNTVTSPRFRFYAEEENTSGIMMTGTTKISSNPQENIAVNATTSSTPLGTSEATYGQDGLEGYFDHIRSRWDTFIEDASPFWLESNKPGWCCGTHDIQHSHSWVDPFGNVIYDYITVTESAPVPPLYGYEWNLNYLDDNMEFDMNHAITGYRSALTDEQISNSWDTHLDQQNTFSNYLQVDKMASGTSTILQQGFSNNVQEINNSDLYTMGYHGANAGPVVATATNNNKAYANLSNNAVSNMATGQGINPINAQNASAVQANNGIHIASGSENTGSAKTGAGGQLLTDSNLISSTHHSATTNTTGVTVTSVEVVDQLEPKIIVPYQIFTEAEADAYQLWNYGIDTYLEMKLYSFEFSYSPLGTAQSVTHTSSIDKFVWKDLISDDYGAFKNAYFDMEDRADYYMQEHPGPYKISISGNLGFTPTHIPGGALKRLTFHL